MMIHANSFIKVIPFTDTNALGFFVPRFSTKPFGEVQSESSDILSPSWEDERAIPIVVPHHQRVEAYKNATFSDRCDIM
jgi:hypothetical protein